MNTDSNVVRLRQPDEIDDPLTDVLRAGARRLLDFDRYRFLKEVSGELVSRPVSDTT